MQQVLAQIAKIVVKEGARATSLLSQRAGKLKELVQPLITAGEAAGVNDAGNAKSVFEALSGFKTSLNGQATGDTHSFLDKLLTKLNGGNNLDADELTNLSDIAEQVSNLPVEDLPVAELQAKLEAVEQATNFSVKDANKLFVSAFEKEKITIDELSTLFVEEGETFRPDKDRFGQIFKESYTSLPEDQQQQFEQYVLDLETAHGVSKDKLAEATKRTTAAEEQLKQAQGSSRQGYKITGNVESDAETLIHSSIDVLSTELNRGNSWVGIAYRWFGGWFLPEGVPRDLKKMPEYLKEVLGSGQFKNAVKGYLNKESNYAEGLNWFQRQALHTIRFSRGVSEFLGEDIRRKIGEIAALGDAGGKAVFNRFVRHIPLVGGFSDLLYGWFRHFVVDYVTLFDKQIQVGNSISREYFNKGNGTATADAVTEPAGPASK